MGKAVREPESEVRCAERKSAGTSVFQDVDHLPETFGMRLAEFERDRLWAGGELRDYCVADRVNPDELAVDPGSVDRASRISGDPPLVSV